MHSRYKVIMERYQQVMVALSECVMKIRLKCSLAVKSRWRHIRLAIKPRYLGNHASQIKSYYESLSGSHGRSFRIRHGKSREAPPSEGLTITSNPVGNTTSLSRKPCMVAKKLLWINYWKSRSLFQNLSRKSVYSVLWRRTDDDVMSVWQ